MTDTFLSSGALCNATLLKNFIYLKQGQNWYFLIRSVLFRAQYLRLSKNKEVQKLENEFHLNSSIIFNSFHSILSTTNFSPRSNGKPASKQVQWRTYVIRMPSLLENMIVTQYCTIRNGLQLFQVIDIIIHVCPTRSFMVVNFLKKCRSFRVTIEFFDYF